MAGELEADLRTVGRPNPVGVGRESAPWWSDRRGVVAGPQASGRPAGVDG
ncbi:hypothetical protein [Streptomyces anulatus]